MYMGMICNPFRKQAVQKFDSRIKNSRISLNSHLRSNEFKTDKIRKKSGHKRSGSSASGGKSQANTGRNHNTLTTESKCIKVFLNNYYAKMSKNKENPSSMKKLINKEAIISYKKVAKNLDIQNHKNLK